MDGAVESTDATRGQAPDRAGHRTRRRAARAAIAASHQARLDELVSHVAAAVDGWREGSLDVYDVDEVLHRYQRAARELWKFCWGTGGGHVEWVPTSFVGWLTTTRPSTGGNAARRTVAATPPDERTVATVAVRS
jgi:hypothetical protein